MLAEIETENIEITLLNTLEKTTFLPFLLILKNASKNLFNLSFNNTIPKVPKKES